MLANCKADDEEGEKKRNGLQQKIDEAEEKILQFALGVMEE
jgi:hypothetical protein